MTTQGQPRRAPRIVGGLATIVVGFGLLATSFPETVPPEESTVVPTTVAPPEEAPEPVTLDRPTPVAPRPTSFDEICPAGLPDAGEAGSRREVQLSDSQSIEVDWSCNDLGESALTRVDLRGADLSGASLRNATLANVDLSGASLRGVDLRGSSLSGVLLIGTDLRGATLDQASIAGSDMTQVIVDESTMLAGASITGSLLPAASLADLDLTGADLSASSLTTGDIAGALLDRAVLVRADLRGATFDGASLSDASLVGATLTGASLAGTDLTSADLTGATIADGQLDTAVLKDATCPDGTDANDNTSATLDANCEGHLGPPQSDPDQTDLAPIASTGPGVMIVLDASDSMNDDDGAGIVKIEAARSGLQSVVSNLPESIDIGLRVYGPAGGCSGREQVPLGPRTRDSIASQIAAVEAGGGTPTAGALEAAAADFSTGAGSRTIILVSDGESNECGDPCAVATELAEQGVQLVQIHTLGFQISDEGRDELECIAAATGGTYRDVNNADDIAKRVSVIAQAPFDWVALGDSYSSGEGAEDFYNLQPESRCHRAGHANWPSAAVRAVNSFTGTRWSQLDVTCSGAHIDDFYAPQYSDGSPGDGTAAQRDALKALAPAGAKIVSLSLGGNDLGFGQLLQRCIVGTLVTEAADGASAAAGEDGEPDWWETGGFLLDFRSRLAEGPRNPDTCRRLDAQRDTDGATEEPHPRPGVTRSDGASTPATVETTSFASSLPGVEQDLTTMLLDLRREYLTHVRDHAVPVIPDLLDERPVRVLVNGYPSFFPDPDDYPTLGSCNFVGRSDLAWIGDQAVALNDALERSVAAANTEAGNEPFPAVPFDVTFEFVPQIDALAGHELCSPGPQGEPSTAGHPDGPWIHGLDARALSAAMGEELRDRAPQRLRGAAELAIARYSYNTTDFDAAVRRGKFEASYQFHPNAVGQLAMAANVRTAILGTPNVPLTGYLGQLDPTAPHVDLQVTTNREALVPGSPIAVDAGPFAPSSEVRVISRSEPIVLGTFETDDDGYLTTAVTLPDELPDGEHTLLIAGTTASGEPVSVSTPMEIKAPTTVAQDIVMTVPAARPRWPTIGIGAALIIGGLALVASGFRRGRRPDPPPADAAPA